MIAINVAANHQLLLKSSTDLYRDTHLWDHSKPKIVEMVFVLCWCFSKLGMSVLQEMDINTWYWWCKPWKSDWQSSWAIYNPSNKHRVSLGVNKIVIGAKNDVLGNYGNQKRHPSSPKCIKSVGPTQSGYLGVFLMFLTCLQESLAFLPVNDQIWIPPRVKL